MTEERAKRLVVPVVTICHDERDEGFVIDVELPGVRKEGIHLEMGTGGLCIRAEKEDLRYEGCYVLAHPVKPEAAKARFENGLLRVRVPFKEPIKGMRVPIE
ncbi:MAG: Hsp20/alpha crystallin family protein [Candidatus Bipolaricaulia bacterium]